MKTREQLAKEFASERWIRGDHNGLRETAKECESTFIAGYEAGRKAGIEETKEYAAIVAEAACFDIRCTGDEAIGIVRKTRNCIAKGIRNMK